MNEAKYFIYGFRDRDKWLYVNTVPKSALAVCLRGARNMGYTVHYRRIG